MQPGSWAKSLLMHLKLFNYLQKHLERQTSDLKSGIGPPWRGMPNSPTSIGNAFGIEKKA